MCRWIFLFFAIPIWASVNQNNDVQLWLTDSFVKQIHPRCTLYLSNEWRIGDNISKLFYVYVQGTSRFALTDRIDFAPGFRQAWNLQLNKWRLEYEPLAEIYFHAGNFVQFRNRISYVIREARNNIWQYRGRLRFNLDYWQVRPFFSEEVFVMSHDGFNQNRTIGGVNVPLFGRSNIDLYYMLRFLKSAGTWTHQHVFGGWVYFQF
ncbi:MAG: DUF2490 domain-containing protein [Parachlamydiales bacterium]|nr:DUF2490 domain-containing protein [Parachlamydiales bacterium]